MGFVPSDVIGLVRKPDVNNMSDWAPILRWISVIITNNDLLLEYAEVLPLNSRMGAVNIADLSKYLVLNSPYYSLLVYN